VPCTNGNCKICPKCGKNNSDEAKYCIECGNILMENVNKGGDINEA
jgi:uncharacterized membrane protein YvbJ